MKHDLQDQPVLTLLMVCEDVVVAGVNLSVLLLYLSEEFRLLILPTYFTAGLSIVNAVILILWVFIGDGTQSGLWNWMPPLVFFRGFVDSPLRRRVFISITGVIVIGGSLYAIL